MTVTIHIVGLGPRFNQIFKPIMFKLIKHNKLEIGYIFSRDIKKAEDCSKFFKNGVPALFSKYKEKVSKLDKSDKNLILVNLPIKYKFETIAFALKNNIAVYTEAPLARKIYEANKYLSMKNRHLLGVAEDLKFSPEFIELKRRASKSAKNITVLNTGFGFSHHLASTLTAFQIEKDIFIKSHSIKKIHVKDLKVFVHYGKFNNQNSFIFFSFTPKNNPLRHQSDIVVFDAESAFSLNNLSAEMNWQHHEDLLNLTEADISPNDRSIQKYKFIGQMYNFDNFITCVDTKKFDEVEYSIENSYADFYISKQILLRQIFHLLPNFLVKIIFWILVLLKKI